MFDTGCNFNAKNFFKNIYIFNVRNNHRHIGRGGIGGGAYAPTIFLRSGKNPCLIRAKHKKLSSDKLLYVCENYGKLGEYFLVCSEINICDLSPPPHPPWSPTILGRNIRSGKLILSPPPNKIRPVRPWK